MTLVTLVVRVSALGARDRAHVCNMGSEHHVTCLLQVLVRRLRSLNAARGRRTTSVRQERAESMFRLRGTTVPVAVPTCTCGARRARGASCRERVGFCASRPCMQ